MLNQMKQLMEMKKKADALQKQLAAIKIEKTNASGTLKIQLNGAQQLEALGVDASWMAPEKKEALEQSLVELINNGFAEAQKKSAAQAAALMQELRGLNIPGM